MLRPDISKALDAAPTNIREEITGPAGRSLELLNRYLSETETVQSISSASPSPESVVNSVLALTDHRLIFVAPAPQAVGWRLSTLTRSQSYAGYFFVEGDAGKYSVGMVSSDWSANFEQQVKQAAAIAVLSNR
jgi:hypothetical protein